jgi:addiction module HigA family antidote
MINRRDLEHADLRDVTTGERMSAIMPGDVLRLEFMEPLGLSARALARDIDVPPNRITEILNGERAVTADTALRLGERFGTSAEMWMNLQVGYDLELARASRRHAA